MFRVWKREMQVHQTVIKVLLLLLPLLLVIVINRKKSKEFIAKLIFFYWKICNKPGLIQFYIYGVTGFFFFKENKKN